MLWLASATAAAGQPGGGAARSLDGRCPEAVVLAIAPLASEATGTLEARSCPAPGVVTLTLRPPGALPLDVEARLGGSGLVSAGAFGLQPAVELDWSAAPPGWDAGLKALQGALGAGGGDLVRALAAVPAPVAPGFLPASVEAEPPPPQAPLLPGTALAAALLGLFVLRGRLRREHVIGGGALFAGACVLRVVLGIWGPLHPSGQGPLWLLGAWGRPELLAEYGPGYPQLFTWIARSAPAPDLAVFAANVGLSAAAAPLGAALLLALGFGRSRAWLAGCLLAAEPFLILLGATESYYPGIHLGVLWGATGLSLADRDDLARSARLLLGLSGALALAQAARTHPLAWPLIATVPFVLLARPRPLSQAAARAALAAAFVVFVVGSLFGRELHEAVGRTLDAVERGALQADRVRWPGGGFWVAAALWTAVGRGLGRRPLGAVLAAIPMLAVYGPTHWVFQESELWAGAYRAVGLALPGILLLGLLPPPRAVWIGPALGLLLLLSGLAPLRHRTTEQLEYPFVRAALLGLREGSRVAYVQRAGRRTITIPEHLVPGWSCGTTSGLALGEPGEILRGLGPGDSRYYYRSSLCSTVQGRPLCEAAEAEARLEPIVETELPAVPSMASTPYDVDRVPVGLYRVSRR